MNYQDDTRRISEQFALLSQSEKFVLMLMPTSGYGSPVGVVTPASIIARYIDLNTGDLWWATGPTDTEWDNITGGGGGGTPAQTLVFVNLGADIPHTADANELTIVGNCDDNDEVVDLPVTPDNGTINTIVNSTSVFGSPQAFSVNANGGHIFGYTYPDPSSMVLPPGSSVTLRYVAVVNTWDIVSFAGSQDTGLITATARNFSQNYTIAQCEVMPAYDTQQGQFFSQAPPDGMDWSPLQVVNPGDAIQVVLAQTLSAALWDSVDAIGKLIVWDQSGANLVACSFESLGVANATSAGAVALTQVQLNGSDLSVSGTDVISADGGIYNVQVKLNADWD